MGGRELRLLTAGRCSAPAAAAAAAAAQPDPLHRCTCFVHRPSHCRRPSTPLLLCRQRTALMSRRFAAAACSPLLLRRVDLPLLDSSSALESLAAWLARHGQHVRSLRYRCGPAHERFAQGLVSGTATCLTAAGAAGQLQDLCVYAALDELHTGWLCTMRSLTRLQLSATPLSISPAIRGLTALQSLTLVGEVDFKAGARLPTAITRLSVECDESGEDLPAQACRPGCWQCARPDECMG